MDRAVENAVYEFFRCFDERDWDGLARCLAPKLFVDYSSFRNEAPGPITANDFVEKRRSALSTLCTQHNATNLRVTTSGDVSTVDCNYQIYRFTDPAVDSRDTSFHSVGRYRFEIAKTASGFRIASIKQTVLRSMGDASIHSGAR